MANTYGFDPVPYAVDGGLLGAEQFRLATYAAGGDEEGIVTPGDCKVTALSTPGSQFQIAGGALRIKNRSANAGNQMYVANGRTTTTLDAPAQQATLQHYLVIVRIEDENYSPWTALPGGSTDRRTKPTFVSCSSTTTTAAELNLNYSAVELARLSIPANTSVITNAMITDLRKVARPRSKRIVQGLNNNTTDLFTYDDFIFHNWPVAASWNIAIPAWATHMVYSIILGQLIPVYAGVATTGYIRLNVGSGQIVGDSVQWEIDSTNNINPITVVNADEYAIPSGIRGTTQNFKMEARRITGTADIKWHPVSSMFLDLTFEERAV